MTTATSTIFDLLPFEPSAEQGQFLFEVEEFLESDEDFFLLRGSAGTGKTSVAKAVVDELEVVEVDESQGEWLVSTFGHGDRARELGLEAAVVAEAGLKRFEQGQEFLGRDRQLAALEVQEEVDEHRGGPAWRAFSGCAGP